MIVLLLNAGSSSLKGSLVESDSGHVLASGVAEWAGERTRYRVRAGVASERSEEVSWTGHAEAVRRFVHDVTAGPARVIPDVNLLRAVGHRVVHGGPFTSSLQITDDVRDRIAALVELAPLHNPPSLSALAAAQACLPHVPHVAVFDTAFHATLSPAAFTYAVPTQWSQDWGVRRYGFHGLSYAYCARRAAEMLSRPLENLRLVVCHLGHGCSATAIQGGRSVETTMGFTPLEGLMMGTRSGSVDPGLLLYVQQRRGLIAQEMETILNRKSGLLGVAGTADVRQVQEAAARGEERAQLALEIYVRRIRQAVGSLAVTMGGVDALVFTAGVGEHSSEVRQRVCTGLECLGLELDPEANLTKTTDADVARPASRGRILIIATREDVTMLAEVMQVLGGRAL